MEAPRGFGDAEVEDDRGAVATHHHVVRGHVAVDEAEWLAVLAVRLVRCVEAAERVDHDGDRDARRDTLLLLVRGLEERRERRAVDEVHDDGDLIVLGDHVEHAHHVGVLDAAHQARLVEEHREELAVAREVRVQPLDRDDPAEAASTEEAPEVHARHPAARDLVVDGVPPDDLHGLSFWGQQQRKPMWSLPASL